MGMASMSPGHVPIGFANLTADKQTWMKIDLVLMSERYQIIELLKRDRIVIAGPRLEPSPHHVQAHNAIAELMHLREIGFNILGIPLHRPLHRSFGRNPMCAHGNKSLPIACEIGAVEMNLWQTYAVRLGCVLRCFTALLCCGLRRK